MNRILRAALTVALKLLPSLIRLHKGPRVPKIETKKNHK